MNVTRRNILSASAAGALTGLPILRAQAQDKTVRFGFALDFTAVYTFVSGEYNQGERDYLTLVNERGGLQGYKLAWDIVDTGNAPQRGIEAYERFKREGAVMVDFLSTPVSRAVVPRALEDKINVLTALHGRSDAADGTAFPYIYPASASYWSQAAVLIEFIRRQEKDLKGKKIALVHIDSPFGKEPIPLLQELAKLRGFELSTFPYASPGNEQSAAWSQVRRARPDWTLIWGAGGGQAVSLKEAVRNGMPMNKIASVVWLAESDAKIAGVDAVKGVYRFEAAAAGQSPKVIQDILKDVYAKGKGAGDKALVGTSYYNIGVMAAAIMVEGARLAIAKSPNGPVNGDWMRAGLNSISKFDAGGLMPPLTVTAADHQGGGFGRVSQWDGKQWVGKSDWIAADQEEVWKLIRASSAEFKKTGK